MIKFSHITIQDWRQFDDVQINFDDRLTILTGANGAGKTTILNILSRHFGWSIHLVSTLSLTRKGAWQYYSGAGLDSFYEDIRQENVVGQLRYSNGEEAALTVPTKVGENYNVNIKNQQSVSGIYITSHRPVYSYQRVDSIPTKIQANQQLIEQYVNNLRQYYSPNAQIGPLASDSKVRSYLLQPLDMAIVQSRQTTTLELRSNRSKKFYGVYYLRISDFGRSRSVYLM